MPDDSPPYDIELEFSLWMALYCQCETCGTLEDLSSFNQLLESDPIAWSKVVTPIVQASGWSTPQEGILLCATCASKRAVTQQ